MEKFSHVKRLFLGEKNRNLLTFILVLIPNSIAAFFEGISFGVILLALKAFNNQQSWDTTWISSFITKITPFTFPNTFIGLMILAIALQVFKSVMSYGGGIALVSLGTRIQITSQMTVYRQILSLSFPCASRYKVGDLLEYAKIPANIIALFIDPLNQLIISGFSIAASFAIMLILSPTLTTLAVFIFGGFGALQKLVMTRISRESTILAEKTTEFSKNTIQNLYALRLIHTYNRQSKVMEDILTNLKQIAETTNKINLWTRSIAPLTEMSGIVLVGFFLILGSWIFSDGNSLLPVLLTFVMVIHRLNNRVQTALTAAATIAQHWGYIKRLEEILDNKDKDFISKGMKASPEFHKEILFDNISLFYEKTTEPSLRSINLSIPCGSTVAFVGFSGAGKSSLLDLLLKLYTPSQGKIYVDGTDLQELDAGDWRNQIGVVSQDTFVFNESIAKNICFGTENATFEKIVAAAKSSGAHEFIMKLPQGYQTIVGERGYRLSGGEKQRIALARALIREPKILVLDEATSSLDSASEQWIQNALEKIQGEKTIIVVAHRLSTILKADNIYMLAKGKIVERGRHRELLEQNGEYARLWKLQAPDTNEQKNYNYVNSPPPSCSDTKNKEPSAPFTPVIFS